MEFNTDTPRHSRKS
jgi:large subunit ribosomal protein L28